MGRGDSEKGTDLKRCEMHLGLYEKRHLIYDLIPRILSSMNAAWSTLPRCLRYAFSLT
jgi:hypothetical protein